MKTNIILLPQDLFINLYNYFRKTQDEEYSPNSQFVIRNSFSPQPTYTLPIPYDGSLEAYRNEMLLCPQAPGSAFKGLCVPLSDRLFP